MKNKEVYENRAQLQDGPDIARDCTDFECCREELVFAMQDNAHQFSLGLYTVLKCLAIAEKEGYVPPLPDGWWLRTRSH